MEMNWIDVNDKLPEDENPVIATLYCGWQNKRYVTMLNYDCDMKEWYDDEYGSLHESDKVTHWMPFPKLPEAEADAKVKELCHKYI